MSEATPPAPPQGPSTDEAKKRQRELVDRLLAQPAVTSEGNVRLGDGRTLGYTVSAGYMPAHAAGIGKPAVY